MINTTENPTSHKYQSDCHACEGTGTDLAFGTPCSECFVTAMRQQRMQDNYSGVRIPAAPTMPTGNGTGKASKVTANKFAGKCTKCGATVEAGAGILGKADGKWTTTHRDGDCLTTEQQLARKATQQASQTVAATTGLDLSSVPAGMYAVPGGTTGLKVRIDNVTDGKWAGWVFVKDGAVYGQQNKYGTQRPGDTYKGKIADQLAIIAADPKAAAAAYGKITNTCGMCGKKLEDDKKPGKDGLTSVQRGIGPICAEKF